MPAAPVQTLAIDPAQAAGPQVYRLLRERIVRNELPPGARISEAEIALACRVSRQPVREAFIKLAEEGLVEVRPQRGTFVRRISVGAVTDARFVREAIEADVVKLLAANPDPALVRDLDRQIAAQREIAASDLPAFVPMDDLFHRTLAEAAGKPFAWMVIESLKSQMDRVRRMSTQHFSMRGIIDHHAAIAAAIARGSVADAEAAMRLHLREILRDLPVIRQARPDLFDETGA